MADPVPAVALLFDDTDLGGQLREALLERGARIVHEGGVGGISRELLQRVGADVLVVNLDDDADDALDHLYEVIDGDRPRVVFNDAQASRGLGGWDRARWARHLAVKVMASGDIDPPRPDDARDIEAPAVAPVAAAPAMAGAAVEAEADFLASPEPDGGHGQGTAAESENLAAELEALLAAGELPADGTDESGPGLRHFADGELPVLHDGNFGPPMTAKPTTTPPPLPRPAPPPAPVETLASVTPPAFRTDHLQLSALTDPAAATVPAAARAAPSVRAPDGWTLVDDDAAAPAPADAHEEAVFGIEKLSAADFLAPDVEAVAADLEPVMSLELVSMEEAIAPQVYEEHHLAPDAPGGALTRVVVLGAAADGVDSVCRFLAALPPGTGLTFLHTQHLGGLPDAELVKRLAAHSALPVRLAGHGDSAGNGVVLVVPAGQQVRLHRDGSVELRANPSGAPREPSIDASLTMAANGFGRDALAIVFAGRGNDAVAGAQAVHDRGGEVWVESSSGEHHGDMVSGIFAERLVSFSGTPHELAARLIEVFP